MLSSTPFKSLQKLQVLNIMHLPPQHLSKPTTKHPSHHPLTSPSPPVPCKYRSPSSPSLSKTSKNNSTPSYSPVNQNSPLNAYPQAYHSISLPGCSNITTELLASSSYQRSFVLISSFARPCARSHLRGFQKLCCKWRFWGGGSRSGRV